MHTKARRSRPLSTAHRLCQCAVIALCLVSANNASADFFSKLKKALGQDDETQVLNTEEIGRGLKEALTVGTRNVVENLGQPGGFNLDPEIHIPLPSQLDKVQDVLEKVGLDDMLTDLETRLNQAAEDATPKARSLFMAAIEDMTLEDVKAIYEGPDDAATQYFRARMAAPLAADMKPVVDASLADVGAAQSYAAVVDRYEALPFTSEVDMDLSDYVVDGAMDGIFFYLAKEEAAIRENPAKRTTELLRKVFGG